MQIKKKEVYDEIIQSASRLFAKRGIQNTTLRNIAENAHISVGNIYNYFESKEEILDVIAEQTTNKLNNFLNNEFERIIRELNFEGLYDLVNTLLPCQNEYEIYGEQFITLMERTEGTKYQCYKKSLLRVVDNFFVEYMREPKYAYIRKSLSCFFTQLLIEKSKQNIFGEEKETDFEKTLEMCSWERDDEEKVIYYYIGGFLKVYLTHQKEFFEAFNSAFKGIDPREYTAIIDYTEMEEGNPGILPDDFEEQYWTPSFKRRQFIFLDDQIILTLQVQQHLKETQRKNYEIIIRNRITSNEKVSKTV